MAGLFRAPKPVVVPAPAPASTPSQSETAAASREAEAEAARIENRARARNGIAGTVATSASGVLTAAPVAATRKSLLGE